MPKFEFHLAKLAFCLGALALSACFQENVTLGLPCSANDQCGVGQTCDSLAAQCVEEGKESQTSGSGNDSTEDTGSQGEPCAVNDEQRCDPEGIDVQICTNGIWLNFDCDDVCEDANEPPGKQVGACVDESGSPSCLCADSIGGECVGNEGQTCTDAGLLEICSQGRFFRLMCSTSCGDDGYPVAGPCIDDPGQGSPHCICADQDGGSCTIVEQYDEGCASGTVQTFCDGETVWLIDCEQECMRNGQSGGTCQDQGGGNFSCVCG